MSRALPLTIVDAFAHAPFTGNPAAVITLDTWPHDAVMQAIAAQNNLPATAFAMSQGPDYDLRWFSPTAELSLCGHATLAAGHVLIGNRDAVRFRTKAAGDLIVEQDGEALALTLPDWKATPRALPGIAAGMGGAVVESLWHDSGYAVLVYPDAAAIRALVPDFLTLAPLGNILIIATAPGDDTDIISRAFLPHGDMEDPVTGSAHCVIAAYWAQRLGRGTFTAYQASTRGGYLGVRYTQGSVILTGRCRTVLRGEFLF
ncbi:MAG: PhzF family phenazine biosynthesis protein [Sphingobium sp.]